MEEDIVEDGMELCRIKIQNLRTKIDSLSRKIITDKTITAKNIRLERIKWLQSKKSALKSDLKLNKKLTVVDEIIRRVRLWN